MTIKPLFDGWWLAAPDGTYQVRAGDEYHIEFTRGPFPTQEMAEEHRFRDWVESYWEHGLAVYADHCLGCGKFAKVLAFDNSGMGWSWRVTECKFCGILDSRTQSEHSPGHQPPPFLETK